MRGLKGVSMVRWWGRMGRDGSVFGAGRCGVRTVVFFLQCLRFWFVEREGRAAAGAWWAAV